MITFYVERISDKPRCILECNTIPEAVEKACNQFPDDVLVVYHESDTPDGFPFIIDYRHFPLNGKGE